MAKGDSGSGLFAVDPIESADPQELLAHMQRQFAAIGGALEIGLARYVEFLNVAPDKPREGMIRGADGTNWNPGSGKGLYIYIGTSWLRLVTQDVLDLGIDPLVVPVGVVEDYIGSSAPTGYVLADGKTIGDASSGGTERANADTVDLFTLLWNSMADAQAPVSTGRGASAAADFAAHKTITLPDLRGRVVIGKDNMGGTTASRITAGVSGITGTTLGAAGGDQSMQSHGHGVNDPGHAHTLPSGGPGGNGAFPNSVSTTNFANISAGSGTGISIQANGSGGSQNVQPSYVLNKIIKL